MPRAPRTERMLAIRVRPELYADLEAAAERQGATLSDIVRTALQRSLDQETASTAVPAGREQEFLAAVGHLLRALQLKNGESVLTNAEPDDFAEFRRLLLGVADLYKPEGTPSQTEPADSESWVPALMQQRARGEW